MKFEILHEKENKPLARKEIQFRVDHRGTGTPSRADVKDKIVAQFDADPMAVVVRQMETKYGLGVSEGFARIYENPEKMKLVELDHIVKRHEGKKSAEG